MTSRSAVPLVPTAVLLVLLAGLGLQATNPEIGRGVWTIGLYVFGLPLVIRTLVGVVRGKFAADLIAALALGGAMLLDQPLAGLVVALMQTGGEALEGVAERRATQAVAGLEARAPRIAHRRLAAGSGAGRVEDIPVHDVRVADAVLVRPGEMVPCDGVVIEGEAAVDISGVTGEPVPLSARDGALLRSGSFVLDAPLVLRVEAIARDSLYERIVSLVRTAQAHKAPLQRAADRAAVWFTPVTIAVCLVAWAISTDSQRVLAILVVATPCPLILATPMAVIGGINRAATEGIIIRHGGALEALARADLAVFDKTGTLTLGAPDVTTVMGIGGHEAEEILQLAASIEEGAGHPLARSVVRAALGRGLALLPARGVMESPGRGVHGWVGPRRVAIGSQSLMRELHPELPTVPATSENGEGGLRAIVVVDGQPAGLVRFDDLPREDAAHVLMDLEGLGVRRRFLLSGDHEDTVQAVARQLGFTDVRGALDPKEKADVVTRLRAEGHTVLAVGDGINDAPALGTADVGMALAEHGGGITAQAADIVVLRNDLQRVVVARSIAMRTMRIARHGLAWGLGLSGVAMVIAAMGAITPTAGAFLQEGIDLAVILNALRAARGEASIVR